MRPAKTVYFYLCDANYHEMSQYSIYSLLRVADRKLTLYFFQYDYEAPCPALQQQAQALGHDLIVETLPANKVGEAFERKVDKGAHRHITGTSFLKAFLVDRLARKYDYVVYLDSDVLFYEPFDFGLMSGFDETAAGVLDYDSFSKPDFYRNCEREGLSPAYVNAGFMAFNARKWKARDCFAAYQENIRQHLEGCVYFEGCRLRDQCPMNLTVDGDVRIWPLGMNVQQWAIGTDAWAAATVRHYVGSRKFMSPNIHSIDQRERQLLGELEAGLGLGALSLPLNDFGLAFALNKVRRKRIIDERRQLLATYADKAAAHEAARREARRLQPREIELLEQCG